MRSDKEAHVGWRYVRVGERFSPVAKVDWKNAPSQFKLYGDCPRLGLSYDIPTHGLKREEALLRPTFEQVGQLLSDIYGVTRQRWTSYNSPGLAGNGRAPHPDEGYLLGSALRPVPSGGGLFPCELYLAAGQEQCVSAGIYHYDAAHHMLDALSGEDQSSSLAASLGRSVGELPAFALLLSISFRKNAFKYGEFSYRLHSLDAGVLIGQSLAIASRYGFRTAVHYHFLDLELDNLLGLEPMRESVYAVVTLGDSKRMHLSAADVDCEDLEARRPTYLRRRYSKRRSTTPWSLDSLPLPAELHRASIQTAVASFRPGKLLPPVVGQAPESRLSLTMPDPSIDLLKGSRLRHSSIGYFKLSKLTLSQLSQLIAAGAQGYSNDLHRGAQFVEHTLLFCAVNNVEGIEPGIYYYHPSRHTLEQVYAADIRARLQATLTFNRFNLFRIGLCVFPVASYESGFRSYGDRWYRVQNMEAGIIVQRLYLAAASLGLGCQANLGYSVQQADALLGLSKSSLTSLAQVMIGPEHVSGHYYECNVQ